MSDRCNATARAPRGGRRRGWAVGWLAWALVALVMPSSAGGEVPTRMMLQGHLAGAGGAPSDGPVDLIISVYSSESGLVPLYSEYLPTVPLDLGRFAVVFGAGIPVEGVVDTESLFAVLGLTEEAWVGVRVDGGAEITRRRLESVPYALHARRAAAADQLSLSCPEGTFLRHGALGWSCGTITAADLQVPYALGTGPGGAAAELACDGCVDASDLALVSVNGSHLVDGTVDAEDVAFAFAAGVDKGGAAVDLVCEGCVQASELAPQLVISGPLTADALAASDGNGDGVSWRWHESAAGELQLSEGLVERATFDDGGNLNLTGGLMASGGIWVGDLQVVDAFGNWTGWPPIPVATPGLYTPLGQLPLVGAWDGAAPGWSQVNSRDGFSLDFTIFEASVGAEYSLHGRLCVAYAAAQAPGLRLRPAGSGEALIEVGVGAWPSGSANVTRVGCSPWVAAGELDCGPTADTACVLELQQPSGAVVAVDRAWVEVARQ